MFVVETKLIQNGIQRLEGRVKPFTSQTANVRQSLNLAQRDIHASLNQVVLMMELMIQASFVQVIHAVEHLIVSPCQNQNFIVFAIRVMKRIEMISAKKLLTLTNVKWKMTVRKMQIALILYIVRDQNKILVNCTSKPRYKCRCTVT